MSYTVMTNEKLTQLWKEYWANPDCKWLRFGQFVFNQTSYEYKNSYEVQNAYDAYDLLRQGLEW